MVCPVTRLGKGALINLQTAKALGLDLPALGAHPRRGDRVARRLLRLLRSPPGRFCCKSLFALAIKISFGRTGDFHVNMWGTSSSEEKRAGDPGNVIEATSIGGRRFGFFCSRKINAGQFRTFATISALLGHRKMSDLSPQSGLKQTLDQGRCHALIAAPSALDQLAQSPPVTLVGALQSRDPTGRRRRSVGGVAASADKSSSQSRYSSIAAASRTTIGDTGWASAS